MIAKTLILAGCVISIIGIYLSFKSNNEEEPENLHTLGNKTALILESTRLSTKCDSKPCIISYWDESLFKDLKIKAEKGDTDAQQVLGYLYLSGEFPKKDLEKAEKWLLKAAKTNVVAQTQLAFLYGQRGDMTKAEEWYRRASNNGSLEARNNLTLILSDREAAGEKINKKELISLLESLVEQNFKPAFYTLAWTYLEDNDVKNEKRGLELLIIAAKNGDSYAEYMLAELYEEGYLVEKNLQKSRELYAKAASKNMPEAIEKIRLWEIHYPESKEKMQKVNDI